MNLTFSQSVQLPANQSAWQRRKLIIRDGRPVGHCTQNGKYFELWLQNYAGYYSDDFVLKLDSEAIALKRAEEILTEWDETEVRSTYIA